MLQHMSRVPTKAPTVFVNLETVVALPKSAATESPGLMYHGILRQPRVLVGFMNFTGDHCKRVQRLRIYTCQDGLDGRCRFCHHPNTLFRGAVGLAHGHQALALLVSDWVWPFYLLTHPLSFSFNLLYGILLKSFLNRTQVLNRGHQLLYKNILLLSITLILCLIF